MRSFLIAAILALTAVLPPALAQTVSQPGSPTLGPRPLIALVIAPEKFRDEELFVPLEALAMAGYQTLVVSTKMGKAVGMLKGTVDAAAVIEELQAGQLAGLILVGGAGAPAHLWDHPALRRLVTEVARAGKPLGAICLAPIVLARAGLLKGRKATAWKDDQVIAELRAAGATWADQPCVEDGQIVTGNGPTAAAEFAGVFVRKLSGPNGPTPAGTSPEAR